MFLALNVGIGHAEGPLAYEEAYAAVCSYDWDCTYFLEVAWRESNWTPSAVNEDCDLSGTYRVKCYGFLQLESGWGSKTELLDLKTNLDRAYALYLLSGKTPWGG